MQDDFDPNYQLLGRLQQDCEYFLGFGNRNRKHLWAVDEAAQIRKMKELYAGFGVKPDWISMRDIKNYESQMVRDPMDPAQISMLTRAHNERLQKALQEAAPIIERSWTVSWKKDKVRQAVSEPVTDSRDQALRNTFLMQECWALVYEPSGFYPTSEHKALVAEFRVLLSGIFFDEVRASRLDN